MFAGLAHLVCFRTNCMISTQPSRAFVEVNNPYMSTVACLLTSQNLTSSEKYCRFCVVSLLSTTAVLIVLLCLTLTINIAHADSDETTTAPTLEDIDRLQQSIAAVSTASVLEDARNFAFNVCQQFRQGTLDETPLVLPADWQIGASENNAHNLQPETDEIVRRGRTVGNRYSWRLSLIDQLAVSVYGEPQRPFVELLLGDEYPVLRVITRDCETATQHRIEYQTITVAGSTTGFETALSAHQLVELNTSGEVVGEVALLNPGLPDALQPDFPATSHEGSDSIDIDSGLPIVPVALVDSGVNYLLPEIADSLLRDASGGLAGYDYWDDDNRPFDLNLLGSPFNIQRHGTRTASILAAEAPGVRIAPFRFPRPHMHRMRELIAHIARFDIKLVGMALGGNRAEEWKAFEQAAKDHPDMLFVVSAGNNGRNIDQQPVYPAALFLENMIVVSSADDSTLPAEGSNWGREHVDYLLPAEHVEALDFDGSLTRVSGSSYAVSRMLALLVKLKQQHPDWQTSDIKTELRRRFHDGARAQYIGGGYIGDPLSAGVAEELIVETSKRSYTKPPTVEGSDSVKPAAVLDYELIVLDSRWDDRRIKTIHVALAEVLAQCNVHVNNWSERHFEVAAHLASMSVGGAKTLREQLRPQNPTIYLATSTRTLFEQSGEAFRFDAEAFGRANTRGRDWLRDTVWISENVQDVGLAAAHEIVHVLMNDGGHVNEQNNLMNTTTAAHNRLLNPRQCKAIHDNGLRHGMLTVPDQ